MVDFNVTEETAKKMGYPSLEVYHLEDELEILAERWAKAESEENLAAFRTTLIDMIEKSYKFSQIPIEAHLPLRKNPDLLARIRSLSATVKTED